MSWGYRHGTGTVAQDLQRNKTLVNTTEIGTNVYKSVIGNGICKVTVIWHDNRNSGNKSHLIIKDSLNAKHFEVSDLTTQKAVFEFAENKIKELKM